MGLVQGVALVEHAVQTEAHAGYVAVGLDMDVARPGAYGLSEDHVDQPDEGGFAAVFEQVFHGIFVEFVDGVDRVPEHVGNGTVPACGFPEHAVDDVEDVGGGGQHRARKALPEQQAQFLRQQPAGRLARRQHEHAFPISDGHDHVLA